jgi:hypothetical protein
MNSMLDNLENVVVTYQKMSSMIIEKIEKLESSRDDTAPEEKGDNSKKMTQPTNDAAISVETPDSQVSTFVDMKQEFSYSKTRFVLGLVTLISGVIAANLALFHWVEIIGLHYLLGSHARYVCACGGFAAMIFGAILVDNFLVLSAALRMCKPNSA